jgi:4'-phosphopantetheinyl transferase
MPLLLHQLIEPAGELGVWRVEEPEEWFAGKLELSLAEGAQLAGIKGRRRVEWLAARHLVHLMSGRQKRGAFLKDEYGKPRLEDAAWHISISHSHELVAAIAAPAPVGVDIQYIVPKIERLAHKYLREEELRSLRPGARLEQLHVYWGAKESLFKAYGRREMNFREDLRVKPFEYQSQGGSCEALVVAKNYRGAFRVVYRRWEDYLLVYAVENANER